MSFVYPSFLWALTALSIPIIIHLFNFRRTTRIYFSSNRFLRQVQEATTAKRKLKHFLILISRLCFLFFLVITFCQPFIPAKEQTGEMKNIVIYLDNSLSMSVPVSENTRALDEGVLLAREVVEVFPAQTKYQLITNDFAPFSNTFKTKTEIQDALTQIRLSPIQRSVQEVSDRIERYSGGRGGEVFWISDFQQSTVGKLDDVRIDSAWRWYLVPLSFNTSVNIFIDSAYLENPFVVGGERNTLHVRLRNEGEKSVDKLLVKLTLNGVQAGTSSVDIAARGITTTSFDLTTGLSGVSRAVISFNDYPVSFDNEFYMALNFSEKINVVEIKNENIATPVEKVFGNRRVFNFQSYTEANFNYSRLAEADLVVLDGLDRFDQSLSQALSGFVRDKGTLLVIPGKDPDVKAYSELLHLPQLQRVQAGQSESLDNPDFSNPFFENVFEERNTRMEMPTALRVLDWGYDRSAILKFKNDAPYLSVFQSQGRIYLLGSPLQSSYSSLANNALFVPIMYRIASSGKRNEVRPYYKLDESYITLKLDSIRSDEPLKFVGEQEIIPPQRKMSNQVVMELPRFSMNAGFYSVLNNRDTVGLLGFNLDPRESVLRQYSADELVTLLGRAPNVTLFESNSKETFSNEIKERYLGKPLWRYALILALLFLLVEILLIRFLK